MAKKIPYEITNMVAAGDIGIEIDLYRLMQEIREEDIEIEYEPEQFPGAILKFKKFNASMLLFKNGKVVVVGCKTPKEIEKVLAYAKKVLPKYAKKILTKRKPVYEITNMVAATSLDMDIDLFRLALEITDVEYEPEQFPGAILKFEQPKVSMLIFKNGKAIVAGAKTEKDIEKALQKAKKLLMPFRKKK